MNLVFAQSHCVQMCNVSEISVSYAPDPMMPNHSIVAGYTKQCNHANGNVCVSHCHRTSTQPLTFRRHIRNHHATSPSTILSAPHQTGRKYPTTVPCCSSVTWHILDVVVCKGAGKKPNRMRAEGRLVGLNGWIAFAYGPKRTLCSAPGAMLVHTYFWPDDNHGRLLDSL